LPVREGPAEAVQGCGVYVEGNHFRLVRHHAPCPSQVRVGDRPPGGPVGRPAAGLPPGAPGPRGARSGSRTKVLALTTCTHPAWRRRMAASTSPASVGRCTRAAKDGACLLSPGSRITKPPVMAPSWPRGCACERTSRRPWLFRPTPRSTRPASAPLALPALRLLPPIKSLPPAPPH